MSKITAMGFLLTASVALHLNSEIENLKSSAQLTEKGIVSASVTDKEAVAPASGDLISADNEYTRSASEASSGQQNTSNYSDSADPLPNKTKALSIEAATPVDDLSIYANSEGARSVGPMMSVDDMNIYVDYDLEPQNIGEVIEVRAR